MGKNWVWVVREMRVEIPGYTEVEYVAQCESKSQARDVIREKEAQLDYRGANHKSTNLITVCRTCNSSRQDTPYVEFAAKFPGSLERIKTQRYAVVNLGLAKSLIYGEE